MEDTSVVHRYAPAPWRLLAALALCAASAAGCAYCTIPRIDPTGRHVLICDPPRNPPLKPDPGCPTHKNMMCVAVAPAKVIAPVGAEVVLVGTVCGPDGNMWANERVEWMLAPGGVGQFVTVERRGVLDAVIRPREAPHKVDNSYVVGATSTRYVALTRGTPTPTDDVPVQRGQAWVSVTSPVEGTSHVTAYAPSVYEWGKRQQTATIYWVDAQWAFPPPANNPVGGRHVFTTTMTRRSDGTPLVGWIVRYEITGGPAAGFAPDGGSVVEVPTNALGQASAEIFEQQPAPGTNNIAIQIIRPADLSGSYGQRLTVANGTTQKTWSTAGSLTLRTTGPVQATVGSTVEYRVEVANVGALSARQVAVTNPVPAGLTFISSNPPAQAQGGRLEYRLGDIGAGQAQAITIDFRADRAATISNCATLTAADGVSAQSCATTTVTGTAVPTQSLTLTMTGPRTAVVGQDIEFVATVTNRGTAPASGLVIVDRFDAGLEHTTGADHIERDIDPPLAAGESRDIIAPLRVTRAGQLCNNIEIVSGGVVQARATACVVATAAGAPGAVVPGAPAAPAPPSTATPPPGAAAGAAAAVAVKTSGPTRATVGRMADFAVQITNTGRAPVTQLRLACRFDRGLEPANADQGYEWVGEDLVWVVGSLPAGQNVTFRVQCRCVAAAARACVRATIATAEGARNSSDACLEIVPDAAAAPPPPAAAARLGMTIADIGDPVSVGRETTYEVKITNAGAAPDRQVALVATVPAEMTPSVVGTSGPSRGQIAGKTIRFDPVAELKPGETLTYQIRARADRPGQLTFTAQATSAGLPAGTTQQESTTVFAE
ncbi:MAG: DUF11 domain-containing protein [Planctomycetia bacterium]|nr:DUF11 domain-containing protein [Planctomycetia bacterium]